MPTAAVAALTANAIFPSVIIFPVLLQRRQKFKDAIAAGGPLKVGSRICVDVMGTVYHKTDAGDSIILVDGSTDMGVLFLPKDVNSESCFPCICVMSAKIRDK